MDTAPTDQIEIDLGDLDQTYVDGHGDTFSITPTQFSHGSLVPGYGAVPPMPAVTWPTAAPTYTFNPLNLTSSNRISLVGTDADIEINGESVVSMLRDIRDRLNILQVSEALEAEWAELRVLREHYEAKLIECRAKSHTWKSLTQPG